MRRPSSSRATPEAPRPREMMNRLRVPRAGRVFRPTTIGNRDGFQHLPAVQHQLPAPAHHLHEAPGAPLPGRDRRGVPQPPHRPLLPFHLERVVRAHVEARQRAAWTGHRGRVGGQARRSRGDDGAQPSLPPRDLLRRLVQRRGAPCHQHAPVARSHRAHHPPRRRPGAVLRRHLPRHGRGHLRPDQGHGRRPSSTSRTSRVCPSRRSRASSTTRT